MVMEKIQYITKFNGKMNVRECPREKAEGLQWNVNVPYHLFFSMAITI